ncbi:MAG: ABC transporter permease [Oscillospiraceae bacterium]|jgi:multidrug/hemolysin transport system permease protein|nr:ABC transporter permease [Oscillospiraceae bacterium]
MKKFNALLIRNNKLFIRDKSTVFFSILSVLILISLYFLFIGKQYASGLVEGTSGTALGGSESKAYFLVYLQMMAGIMVLNSVSLCTGVYGTLARDFETRKIDSFLITHTKTFEILLSYLASGFSVSYMLNMLTWIITVVLITVLTGYSIAASTFITVTIALLLVSFVGASIMLLVTAFVKSSAAVGVITGILGTFFGFLCGIYMPLTQLGSAAGYVGSILPFTHLSVWLKNIVLKNAFNELNITSPEFKDVLLSNFTADNIGFLGININLSVMLLLCAAVSVLCAVGAYGILARRVKNN